MMPDIQITEWAVVVIAVCVTIICIICILRARKIKLGKSGVELEMTKKEPDITPDTKETINEMDA
jgi:hypothetical protein